MDALKKLLREHGAGQVGFADLAALPAVRRNDLRYGIAISVPLDPITVIGMEYDPAGNFDADYLRVNDLLEALSARAVDFLHARGHSAMALPVATPDFDQITLSTELPHKTVATRAGLGWIGKCALLVTELFGSAVRLTSVLTNAELAVDNPIDDSRCGDCEACLNVCPSHAPSGVNWRVGMDRDSFFNPFSCRQTRSEMAQMARVKIARCGMCIAVCPWTKEYIHRVFNETEKE